MRGAHEALAARVAAEAKLQQVQADMERRITALLIENARLKESPHLSSSASTSTSSRPQRDDDIPDLTPEDCMDTRDKDEDVKDPSILQRFQQEIPSPEKKKTRVRQRKSLLNSSRKQKTPKRSITAAEGSVILQEKPQIFPNRQSRSSFPQDEEDPELGGRIPKLEKISPRKSPRKSVRTLKGRGMDGTGNYLFIFVFYAWDQQPKSIMLAKIH